MYVHRIHRNGAVDKLLMFSLSASLLLHSAAYVYLSSYFQVQTNHIFILLETGEEAVQVEIGSAYESAPATPRPEQVIKEQRIEEMEPLVPDLEKPAPISQEIASLPILADGLFTQSMPHQELDEIILNERKAPRRIERIQAEPDSMSEPATLAQSETPDPPEPILEHPSSAPPQPSAPAMVLGGEPRPRGIRQRAVPTTGFSVRYPDGSRRRGETGVTLVRASIDRRGRCTSAVVERSSGYPALDAAALTAVRQARYRPAVEDTMQVQTEERFEIVFNLR